MRTGYVFIVLFVVAAAFLIPKLVFRPAGSVQVEGGVELIVMDNCGGCVPPVDIEEVVEVVEGELEKGLFSAEGLPGFFHLVDVSGVIYDEAGSPVPGAEVVLYASKESPEKAFEMRQNADESGKYSLSAYTKDAGLVEQLLLSMYANTGKTLKLLVPPGDVQMRYGSGPYELPSGTANENVEIDHGNVEGSVHAYNSVVEGGDLKVELDSYYTELEYPQGMIIAAGISSIPENLMPAAKRIDWVFKKDVRYSGDVVGGIYFENRSIYVSMDTDPYVPLHELGHHIEFMLMTEDCYLTGEREGMRKQHIALFNNKRPDADNFCCTGQFEEEFSNLFASYIVYGPEPLYRLAGGSRIKRAKVEFFDDYIFNDVAFECS